MRALLLLLLASSAWASILPAPVDVVKSVPLSVTGSSVTVYQGGAPWSVTGSTVIIATEITLGASTNTIGNVGYTPSEFPVISSAAVTASDIIILPANPARKAVECQADCTNTGLVNLKFNATAATGAVMILGSCTAWQPAPGVAMTGSLHLYAPVGSQVVRCTEYP